METSVLTKIWYLGNHGLFKMTKLPIKAGKWQLKKQHKTLEKYKQKLNYYLIFSFSTKS